MKFDKRGYSNSCWQSLGLSHLFSLNLNIYSKARQESESYNPTRYQLHHRAGVTHLFDPLRYEPDSFSPQVRGRLLHPRVDVRQVPGDRLGHDLEYERGQKLDTWISGLVKKASLNTEVNFMGLCWA